MPGSALMRQVARTGDGAIAHANANANSSATGAHNRPPAALEARRLESLKLLMRETKVRVCRESVDTKCHGFSYLPKDAATSGATAALWPSRAAIWAPAKGSQGGLVSSGAAS